MLRDIKEGNEARENGLWKTEVEVGRPNNPGTLCSPASLPSSCPGCSFQNPTLQVTHQVFLDPLCSCEKAIAMLFASCWRGTQGSSLGRYVFISTRSLQIPIRQCPCRFSPSLTLFSSAQGVFYLSSDPIGTLNGAFIARAIPSSHLPACHQA